VAVAKNYMSRIAITVIGSIFQGIMVGSTAPLWGIKRHGQIRTELPEPINVGFKDKYVKVN
jgi:hypothetical protein